MCQVSQKKLGTKYSSILCICVCLWEPWFTDRVRLGCVPQQWKFNLRTGVYKGERLVSSRGNDPTVPAEIAPDQTYRITMLKIFRAFKWIFSLWLFFCILRNIFFGKLNMFSCVSKQEVSSFFAFRVFYLSFVIC